MKKIIILAAFAAASTTVFAQEAMKTSKTFDNVFISLQGGVYEPTIGQSVFGDMRATTRFEFGKYFTPSFGLSISADGGINANNGNYKSFVFQPETAFGSKTVFDYSNISLNALFNVSNLFGGYKGQPRPVELIAQAGLGWGHLYGQDNWAQKDKNFGTASFALGLDFNVSDAWAINFRPAISYALRNGNYNSHWALDVRQSILQVTAGLTYKFGNSNGTHHFVYCNNKYTQAEMDEMNAKINAMRADYAGQLNAKDSQIAALNAQIAELKARPMKDTVIVNTTNIIQQTTQLAPVVIFDQGKSTVNKAQQPSVQMIATYMKNHPDSHVTIKGYASPEGNADVNQKLSVNRAKSVYDMLVNTYKIAPSRLQYEGLGATADVFPENDWNRVCVFLEETK